MTRSLTFIVALGLIAIGSGSAPAQQQVFRNERGQTTTTATQSGNQATYRDAGGRSIGTGTTDSSGTTVFRDARGRVVGSVSGRR